MDRVASRRAGAAAPSKVTVTRATQRHLHLEEGQQVWVAHTEGARAVPAPAVLDAPLASGA